MTSNIKKYSGKVIQQAFKILSNGELLAIPSETVYGLVLMQLLIVQFLKYIN